MGWGNRWGAGTESMGVGLGAAPSTWTLGAVGWAWAAGPGRAAWAGHGPRRRRRGGRTWGWEGRGLLVAGVGVGLTGGACVDTKLARRAFCGGQSQHTT